MAAGYDNTTWFYEGLSKLIFGNTHVKAQNHFLNQIPLNSNILVIGGGTGQILESISQIHPSGLHIAYVEISPKMMELSRKRNIAQNKVEFITSDIASITFTLKFDVVITAFLFDNFSDESLAKVFPQINEWVKPNGLWFDTDFQLTGSFWQKLMLKSMYLFFGLMKAVEVNSLPNAPGLFARHSYSVLDLKEFYGRFIYTRLYKKASSL